MGDPVVHFEIMGSGNGETLKEFYAKLFGWSIAGAETPQGGYRRVRTGASAGIDGGLGAFPGVPPYTAFYVQTDDLEGTLAAVERLGGEVLMGPREVRPGVRAAMLRDPDGNAVGLLDTPPDPDA